MISRPLFCAALGLLSIGLHRPCVADTITPLAQDRFMSVLVDSDCRAQTSSSEAARGFGPFDSVVFTSHECLPTIAVYANAIQTSTINGSSMSIFAGAHYSAQSPGSVLVSAASSFSVTFELSRQSVFSLTGLLLGGGQAPGVQASAQLTNEAGQVLFSAALVGPFPFGEQTKLPLDVDLILDPGEYELQALALSADGIDITEPLFVADSDLNIQVEVSVLGDLDGDEVVGTADLLTLLAAWGPCEDCPEDLDGDGAVGTSDLLALLANWG